MSWHRNNRHTLRQRRLLLTAGALVLAVVIGVEVFMGGVVRGTVRDMAAAAWQGATYAYEGTNAAVFFSSKRSLFERNKELEQTVDELQALRYQNEVLRAENLGLRAFLRTPEEITEGIVARVLSRPTHSPYDTFIIAAGSDDGVVVGDVVEVASQVAIGEVAEVGRTSSLVSLFSAPGSEHEVIVNDAVLTYYGRGSGNGLLLMPRDVPVAVGDTVFLPSHGLMIGTVGQVSADPEDAYRRVLVGPPANLPALQFVLVRSVSL